MATRRQRKSSASPMPTPTSFRATASRSGASAVRGVRLGPVLGAHEPLHDCEPAVLANGDDAPGDGAVLAPEDRAALDCDVDALDARLGGLRLGGDYVGPLVVVEVVELGKPLGERLHLRGFRIGRLAGLGLHAPVPSGGRPVDHEWIGTRPAGVKLLCSRLEALHRDRA